MDFGFHFNFGLRRRRAAFGIVLELEFFDESVEEDYFNVYLDGVLKKTLPANPGTGIVEFEITVEDFNTEYEVEVKSVTGVTESSVLVRTIYTPPEFGPTNLVATASTPSSITFEWDLAPAEAINGGYRLFYKQDGAPVYDFMDVAAGVDTATPATLTHTQLYSAYLVAFNDNGGDPEEDALSPASDSVLASTAPRPTYLQEVDADSPTNHWRLGEAASATAAVDRKGNHNGGIHTSGITYSLAGAISGDSDTALGVDGVAGYVSLGQLNPATGAKTFEFFAKAGAVTAKFLASNRTASGAAVVGWEFVTNGTSGAVDFRFSNGTTLFTIAGSAGSTTNLDHFACVFTGSVVRFYRNGVQVGTDTAYTGSITNGVDMTLGRRATTYWAGTVDEAVWYPAALTTARILAHYTSSLP